MVYSGIFVFFYRLWSLSTSSLFSTPQSFVLSRNWVPKTFHPTFFTLLNVYWRSSFLVVGRLSVVLYPGGRKSTFLDLRRPLELLGPSSNRRSRGPFFTSDRLWLRMNHSEIRLVGRFGWSEDWIFRHSIIYQWQISTIYIRSNKTSSSLTIP